MKKRAAAKKLVAPLLPLQGQRQLEDLDRAFDERDPKVPTIRGRPLPALDGLENGLSSTADPTFFDKWTN